MPHGTVFKCFNEETGCKCERCQCLDGKIRKRGCKRRCGPHCIVDGVRYRDGGHVGSCTDKVSLESNLDVGYWSKSLSLIRGLLSEASYIEVPFSSSQFE